MRVAYSSKTDGYSNSVALIYQGVCISKLDLRAFASKATTHSLYYRKLGASGAKPHLWTTDVYSNSVGERQHANSQEFIKI